MARLLIAGAEVAGLAAADRLRCQLGDAVEIVRFDQSPMPTFWLSWLWMMTETRHLEQVQRPLADLNGQNFTVPRGLTTKLTPAPRTVVVGDTEWTGDALIVALGADLDVAAVPGLAAESAPLGVARPEVSQAAIDALQDRQIAYHPSHSAVQVNANAHRLVCLDGIDATSDLLACVPPHRVSPVVFRSDLALDHGWVRVNRQTLETPFANVFAIGDVTNIPLTCKPLPNASVFAHGQKEVLTDIITHRLTERGSDAFFDSRSERVIEMGGGFAGFARAHFYGEPTPTVHAYKAGRHWHASQIAFEGHWWAQW